MGNEKKHFVLVAGEASGDMHAAHLVEALKVQDPDITFSGVGGPQMQTAGVHLEADLTKIAVVGFLEVVRHYGTIRRIFHQTLTHIKETQPTAVILVDYPGFNLRLAKKIKTLKKPTPKIIYYISPQVWAWKAKRVHFIKKYVDQMLVIFPFEKDFYARFGMDATFVGHPLVETVRVTSSKKKFLNHRGLDDYKMTIGLLPGSRQREVDLLLPVMLRAAILLKKEFPQMQFLIARASTISRKTIEGHIQKHAPLQSGQSKRDAARFEIIAKTHYPTIHACDLCLVTSGTATLETAILQKPMVVLYKTSLFTWCLAKMFVKIPHIALVNIVAGRGLVPELLQGQATPKKVAHALKSIFTDDDRMENIKAGLQDVKRALGATGASRQAAEEIVEGLKHL